MPADYTRKSSRRPDDNSAKGHAHRIGVACEAAERRREAATLAARLGLPLCAPGDERFSMLLVVAADRLELRQTGRRAPGPVTVDFGSASLDFRRRRGGGRNEAIARAVGLKKGAAPLVFDATAGLGRDGFLLAALGARVVLCERSPVIAALLADGLTRAAADSRLAPIVTERLELVVGNAPELMRAMPEAARPDVVCLDPMYPERTKSALVKKEMRLLRLVVGDDPDSEELLAAALGCARQRVVVKRPRLAAPLPGPTPSLAISGRSSRFDIYLTGPKPPQASSPGAGGREG